MLNEFAFKLNGISLENMLQLDEETMNEAALNNFVFAWCSDDDTLALGGTINKKFSLREASADKPATLRLYRENGKVGAVVEETKTILSSGADVLNNQYILAIPSQDSIPPAQWEIQSSLPGSTFDVFAGSHIFCRGFLFDLKEVK